MVAAAGRDFPSTRWTAPGPTDPYTGSAVLARDPLLPVL